MLCAFKKKRESGCCSQPADREERGGGAETSGQLSLLSMKNGFLQKIETLTHKDLHLAGACEMGPRSEVARMLERFGAEIDGRATSETTMMVGVCMPVCVGEA